MAIDTTRKPPPPEGLLGRPPEVESLIAVCNAGLTKLGYLWDAGNPWTDEKTARMIEIALTYNIDLGGQGRPIMDLELIHKIGRTSDAVGTRYRSVFANSRKCRYRPEEGPALRSGKAYTLAEYCAFEIATLESSRWDLQRVALLVQREMGEIVDHLLGLVKRFGTAASRSRRHEGGFFKDLAATPVLSHTAGATKYERIARKEELAAVHEVLLHHKHELTGTPYRHGGPEEDAEAWRTLIRQVEMMLKDRGLS